MPGLVPRMRLLAALAVGLLAGVGSALAVSACGDDGAATVEEAQEVDVVMTEFDLDPERVRVEEGVIEFIAHNQGERDHVLAVEGSAGEIKRTKRLKPDQSGAIKVDFRPGRYEMYDPLADNRERGMVGRIDVRRRTATATVTETRATTEVETEVEPRTVIVTETRERVIIRTVTETETVTVPAAP